MKKIIITLAGLLVTVVFAPEASAIPVFARQTGLACKACHFQHIPLLNSFGRAFKASGFTLIGAQGKVEDENLSIPANLNLGVLTTFGYEKVSNSAASTRGNGNTWYAPSSGGELSLFYGGRIAEFAGFLSELALTGAAATNSVKMPLLWEVGNGNRVGVVAFSNAGQGVSYSFELLNTGAVNTHKMTPVNGNNQGAPLTAGGIAPHTSVYSAAQYLNTAISATGFAVVAVNPNMGYINIAQYENLGPGTANVGTLPLSYIRAVGLFNAAGWDMGLGLQSFSGTTCVIPAGPPPGTNCAVGTGSDAEAKANIVDFQAQGEVSGMPLGIYTSYGSSPATAGTTVSVFSGVVPAPLLNRRSAFGIGAEIGVIPGKLALQVGFRNGKSGGTVAGTNLSDNAVQIGGVYELAQNIELSLVHTSQSGEAWNVAAPIGKTVTNMTLEALF